MLRLTLDRAGRSAEKELRRELRPLAVRDRPGDSAVRITTASVRPQPVARDAQGVVFSLN